MLLLHTPLVHDVCADCLTADHAVAVTSVQIGPDSQVAVLRSACQYTSHQSAASRAAAVDFNKAT